MAKPGCEANAATPDGASDPAKSRSVSLLCLGDSASFPDSQYALQSPLQNLILSLKPDMSHFAEEFVYILENPQIDFLVCAPAH